MTAMTAVWSGHSSALKWYRRLTASALALSGALFVIYPIVRPFSDEKGLQGAAAFASGRWIVAHTAAMLGFILLDLAFFGLYELLRDTPVRQLSAAALVLMIVATGLTLPFYGAEVFSLHALGKAALARNDGSLISIVHSIRFGPGIAFIVTGLLVLAAASIVSAVAVGRSGLLPRWSGAVLGVGAALYLPQFAAAQPVRVTHGVIMAAGCLILANAVIAAAAEKRARSMRASLSGTELQANSAGTSLHPGSTR